jgi:hypothetical protein
MRAADGPRAACVHAFCADEIKSGSRYLNGHETSTMEVNILILKRLWMGQTITIFYFPKDYKR